MGKLSGSVVTGFVAYLLIAVALWAVVRVFTQKHWARARQIRDEIDSKPDPKAAEAALSGEDEAHLADLEVETGPLEAAGIVGAELRLRRP